jgi:hypothetical protein
MLIACHAQANKVDVIYALSQAWCTSTSDEDFQLLEKYLTSLKPEETILVRASKVQIVAVWLCA